MKRALLFLFLLLILIADVNAQEITHDVKVIRTGLNSPWEVRWGPDGWIWFTERNGKISRLNPETSEQKLLLNDHEVFQWHEGGMMGFDFHPAFPDSPYVYVAHTHYNHGKKPNEVRIYRYTYSDDTLTSKALIYGDIVTNALHAGGRLLINDNYLYLTSGDIGKPDSAQSLTSSIGKIFRIHLDGTIPLDNPYFPSPVWTYGHRNPQGLVMGRHRLYSAEHGNNCDDEINTLSRGLNYGWPLLEGFCDNASEMRACDSTSLHEPLFSWTPTLGISGIDFYDHEAIPEWKNSLLVAALKDRSINQLKLDSSGQRVIQARKYKPSYSGSTEPLGRLRDFCISPLGRVFASTSERYDNQDTSDAIIEFVRTGVVPSETSLVEPHDGSSVNFETVTFLWRTVAGDARYDLEVTTDKHFAIGSSILEVSVGDTLYTYSSLSPAKTYFWRVRESTSGGPWSDPRSFTTHVSEVDHTEAMAAPRIQVFDTRIVCDIPRTAVSTRLTVADLLGRVVYDTELPAGRSEIPLSSISSFCGSCLLRLQTDHEVRTVAVHLFE